MEPKPLDPKCAQHLSMGVFGGPGKGRALRLAEVGDRLGQKESPKPLRP